MSTCSFSSSTRSSSRSNRVRGGGGAAGKGDNVNLPKRPQGQWSQGRDAAAGHGASLHGCSVLEHLQPAVPDWGTQGSAPALGTPSLVLNQCPTSLQEGAAAKAFAACVAFKISFLSGYFGCLLPVLPTASCPRTLCISGHYTGFTDLIKLF